LNLEALDTCVFGLPRYNEGVTKLEIELEIPDGAVDKCAEAEFVRSRSKLPSISTPMIASLLAKRPGCSV